MERPGRDQGRRPYPGTRRAPMERPALPDVPGPSQELGEPEDAREVPGPGARDRAIKTEI